MLHSSAACSLLKVAVVLAIPVPTKYSGSDPVGLQCRCLPLIYPAFQGKRAQLCSPAGLITEAPATMGNSPPCLWAAPSVLLKCSRLILQVLQPMWPAFRQDTVLQHSHVGLAEGWQYCAVLLAA